MVLKRNGKIEPFEKEKIVRACKFTGATIEIAKKIANEIAMTVHGKTTTGEIRTAVLEKLRKENPAWEKSYLKFEKAKKRR